MHESEFLHTVVDVPPALILETGVPVGKIRTFFGTGPGLEYLISRLINAIGDRALAFQMVAQTVQRLRVEFEANNFFKGDVDFFLTSMITLEQCALDMLDIFERTGVYCHQRYMIYTFEGLLPDGSVCLKLINTYEDFCDEYAISLQDGSFDFEQDM